MGASLGTGDGPNAELNLTPLIDIVLVVLIIMMVNIPITVEEMGIKVPNPEETTNTPPPPPDVDVEQLAIAVYEDGTFALNRKTMTVEVMRYEVGRRLRPMEKKRVFVDAHPKVSYAQVVDMMDLAREAGASQVGLARLKEEGPKAPNSAAPGSMPKGIHPGSPIVVGPMSPKVADKKFETFKGNVMACYNQGLARNPKLTGHMGLRVTVAPDGSLMSAEINGDSLGDDEVNACVLATLEALTFQPTEEYATRVVQWPVLFSPG